MKGILDFENSKQDAPSASFTRHTELWSNVSHDLVKRYGEAVYESWFGKMYLAKHSGEMGKVIFDVPTSFMRDWIQTNYLDTISRLFQHYESSIVTVEVMVNSSNEAPKITPLNIDPSTTSETSDYTASNDDNETGGIFSSSLDPRFTFDNFVVGRPNELAYAAAQAVADSSCTVTESNPLFLYGGVGLGKTHLMHSIAWHIKNNYPERKVIYMSAEKFMYQFVRALRNKDIMTFKEQFRSVDVLMIDDIQFICGKDSTQEEFFHTFNALIDNKRQMIISCDRSPSDLDNIEDRIKSRLGWGLVADVHSTTYELRLGILQSKTEQMGEQIPLSVLEFLSSKISSNVRELEGALNKVIAHSKLIGREITIESTQDILRDLLRTSERILTIEDIQRKVAERYNIKFSDMSSAKRSRSIARPRQIAMYLCKHLTSRSLNSIGEAFGKKDHTTVMYAVKTIENLFEDNPETKEEINLLKRILQN